MPAVDDLHKDLRYVRGALEKAGAGGTPASIYLLWAVLGGVGFPLIDLAPRRVLAYWLVAAPLGMLASLWLGHRHARRVGQLDPDDGRRYGLHWLTLPVAAAMLAPLVATGRIDHHALGQLILLLTAVVYFLAAVHLDRRLLLVALLLAAGYLVLFVVDGPVWTVLGLTTAAALAFCAFLAREPRERAAA